MGMFYRKKFGTLRKIRDGKAADPKLSVAIRVRDELDGMKRLWSALNCQTLYPEFEVVVLDSGSTDGTFEFLEEKECTLYSIESSEFSHGMTCNLMFELCKSDIVFFLSGHVDLCDITMFEEIYKYFRGKKIAAGFMRQTVNPIVGFSVYEDVFLRRRFPECEGRVIEVHAASGFSNAAAVYVRSAWEMIPFEDVSGSEDYLWANKFLERGGKIYYFPKFIVKHSHNENCSEVRRRVELNVRARFGGKPLRLRGMVFFFGVFAVLLYKGAGIRDAFGYAAAHSIPYFGGR